MAKSVKIAAVVAVLLVLLVRVIGVDVSTTHLAFVADDRPMRLPGAVRVQVTPSKEPSEAALIFWAAAFRVPVTVTVPTPTGEFELQVRKGQGDDILIPCSGNDECCRVLSALKYEYEVSKPTWNGLSSAVCVRSSRGL